MLIERPEQFEDIYDLAIHKGTVDAAKNRPPTVEYDPKEANKASLQYALCYLLAYDLEKESGLLASTSDYFQIATVLTWNETTGWGTLQFEKNNRTIIGHFSYREVAGDKFIEPNDIVEFTYCYNSDGDISSKIVKPKT